MLLTLYLWCSQFILYVSDKIINNKRCIPSLRNIYFLLTKRLKWEMKETGNIYRAKDGKELYNLILYVSKWCEQAQWGGISKIKLRETLISRLCSWFVLDPPVFIELPKKKKKKKDCKQVSRTKRHWGKKAMKKAPVEMWHLVAVLRRGSVWTTDKESIY